MTPNSSFQLRLLNAEISRLEQARAVLLNGQTSRTRPGRPVSSKPAAIIKHSAVR
jgi:hypothetical protein